METVHLTMAQALVKFLDQQYVEFDGKEHKFVKGIFTIFGHGNVLGLGQALAENPGGLQVFQGRNEQGMAHAAMGFAKQTYRKQIIACTSSVGPGAANMVTAAATASANRIPLLLLPGDTYACRQPDPVLQQIEHYHDLNITTNDAFKAVSRYWDRIVRPEQIMTALINAMRVLTDPAATGAVTLALPQDVQAEAYDYPVAFFKKQVHRIERRPPTSEMIRDAVELIKTKQKPLVICGGGVRYSEAATVFDEFVTKFNLPFGETQAGKSALTWEHSLNMGGIGVTGNLAANTLAQRADLIIGVGTRYTDFTTSSKWLFHNPNVNFININVAEFDAYKLDAVKMVADAQTGLKALMAALEAINYCSAYTTEIAEAKQSWIAELRRLDNVQYHVPDFQPEVNDANQQVVAEFGQQTDSHLLQTRVLGILNEILDREAVVVGASGSLPGDLQRIWRPKAPHTYHMEYGYSCMGYEVNAALGVKLACPEREVYALVGDGAYMMLHSELVTAIQEKRKINVLLFDNMSFGCINNLQVDNGMPSFGTEFRYRDPESGKLDGALVPINFAQCAAGYGCKTYTVRTEAELRQAVADAKIQTRSTLLDIKVLPKTMTHGYDAWWRVGVAAVAETPSVRNAGEKLRSELAKVRQY